jgi:hypothetical protein
VSQTPCSRIGRNSRISAKSLVIATAIRPQEARKRRLEP